jgi:hypothetical protein
MHGTARRTAAALGAAAAMAATGAASAQTVLFDTGPTRQILFDPAAGGNHTLTYVGWSSGNLGAGLEQRWSAQPFTIPAGSWDLTKIDANYFVSGAGIDAVGIRIWSRTGQNAPGPLDEVFAGQVPAPTLAPDPRISGSPSWLAEMDVSALGINLSAGEYYLTIYGIDSTGAGGNIGWLANPEHGINFVDPATNEPFMWRSAQYPSPGFVQTSFPSSIIMQQPGLDPNDIYGAAFTIHGIPTPGTLALLGLGGLLAARRRR